MKMNKKIKKQWVAALCSGDYAQGTESLCRQDYNSEEYHFCCLGVLCDISNPSRWAHFEDSGTSVYHFENKVTEYEMPTQNFLESLGIS
jgi:hypothetical protein